VSKYSKLKIIQINRIRLIESLLQEAWRTI